MEEASGKVLLEIRKILKKKKEENEALDRFIRALHESELRPPKISK